MWVDRGRVLFKADVGSVGVDAAQIQGVWLAPHLRGQGLATPLMAAVTSAVLRGVASEATLYVNDFNAAAIATYEAVLARAPGQWQVWLGYGHALKTANRTADAVAAYRRAIALNAQRLGV